MSTNLAQVSAVAKAIMRRYKTMDWLGEDMVKRYVNVQMKGRRGTRESRIGVTLVAVEVAEVIDGMWVQEDCRCVGAVNSNSNSNVDRMKLKLADENQDFNLAVQDLYDGLQWQIKTAESKQSLRLLSAVPKRNDRLGRAGHQHETVRDPLAAEEEMLEKKLKADQKQYDRLLALQLYSERIKKQAVEILKLKQ
ncbi:hypothetical protein quinque_007090 [Culex quinquefasciatus]